MIKKMTKIHHTDNRAMVYMVDRANVPAGVYIPRRSWVLKTVGNLKSINFKRSDRKLIVVDMSTPNKLRSALHRLRKIMYPTGFTSVAIPKQGRMKYYVFSTIVREILADSIIDIEIYDSVP